jgi:hypothetical protein
MDPRSNQTSLGHLLKKQKKAGKTTAEYAADVSKQILISMMKRTVRQARLAQTLSKLRKRKKTKTEG